MATVGETGTVGRLKRPTSRKAREEFYASRKQAKMEKQAVEQQLAYYRGRNCNAGNVTVSRRSRKSSRLNSRP